MVRQRVSPFGFTFGGNRDAGIASPDVPADASQEEEPVNVKKIKKIKKIPKKFKPSGGVSLITPWSK